MLRRMQRLPIRNGGCLKLTCFKTVLILREISVASECYGITIYLLAADDVSGTNYFATFLYLLIFTKLQFIPESKLFQD